MSRDDWTAFIERRQAPPKTRSKYRAQRTEVSVRFDQQCKFAGLPIPACEFRFHPMRKWRIDYAWPDHKLALEVEGGVFIRGRHSRGVGMVRDMEKYNALAERGWRLLRVIPKQVANGEALTVVEAALKGS